MLKVTELNNIKEYRNNGVNFQWAIDKAKIGAHGFLGKILQEIFTNCIGPDEPRNLTVDTIIRGASIGEAPEFHYIFQKEYHFVNFKLSDEDLEILKSGECADLKVSKKWNGEKPVRLCNALCSILVDKGSIKFECWG